MSEKDSHETFIELCIEYIKWNERFQWRGSEEAGIKARNALHLIRQVALDRRKEIQDLREQRRLSRKGTKGRPPKLHKADGTFAKNQS